MSKRRKLLSAILVVFLLVPVLSGCFDRIELEEMAFVVSLGVDKGPGNTIDVTARIAVPSKLAGGGGSGSGGGAGGGDEPVSGAKPITVRAETMSGALNLLNTTVERRISMMHLANLTIGESLAKDGIIKYIRPLTRYREFRRTVQIFIVRGNVRELYVLNKPMIEQSITRFTESVDDVGRHTGLSLNTKLHEFIIAMETSNEDTVSAVMAINKNVAAQQAASKKGDPSKDVMQGDKPNYKVGQTLRLGGNPLEFIGTGVFRKDKMAVYLDGVDTRLLLTIRGELERTQMDFPDPKQKGLFVSLELKHARRPVVNIDLKHKPIRINIRQTLEGDLIGVQGDVDYTQPTNMKLLESKVRERLETGEKSLIERLYHDEQVEPFGLMKRTRNQFRTMQEMESYDFRDRLKDAVVDVEVNLHMRRVGVQLAPVSGK